MDSQEFVGWFDAAENGTQYTISDITEDITLYAHWGAIIGPIVLPVNDQEKDGATYTVTFKPGNGGNDITRQVQVSYTPNGWLVDGVHYNDGATANLTEDSTVERDYIKNITPAEFPDNPEYGGYTFQGWFDIAATGGNKYTSYNKEKDITLYAHWLNNNATGVINLGTNDQVKDDEILATITFLPHNGEAATVSNVVKSYRANGWLVDGAYYPDGSTVTVSLDATIEPYFTETISNASFPENPTKEGYEFTGWYTGEIGGTKVNILRGVLMENFKLVIHSFAMLMAMENMINMKKDSTT